MSKVRDEVLRANQNYQQTFGAKGALALPPARKFAVLTWLAACSRQEAAAPPSPVPAESIKPAPVADAAVPVVAAAAPPAGDAAPVVLAVGTGDKLTIYELVGSALRERSTIAQENPHVIAWPRADGPIWITVGFVDEIGRVDAGAYKRAKLPGTGDVDTMVTTASGDIWVSRCLKWGDNAEEEGCSKRRFFPLTPGQKAQNRPPIAAALPSTKPPADVKLTVRKVDEAYQLDCTDASGTRAVTPADYGSLLSKPTWQWLSTAPPIALVHLEMDGSGEGAPRPYPTEPYLLRGCVLSKPEGLFAAGPNGMWAEQHSGPGGTDQWTIYRGGTKIIDVDGSVLAFAGGFPFVSGTR